MPKEINEDIETKLNNIVTFITIEVRHVKLSKLCYELDIQLETFSDLINLNYSKFNIEQLSEISERIDGYIYS